MLTDDEKLAACLICTLAPAMRVCDACTFRPTQAQLDALYDLQIAEKQMELEPVQIPEAIGYDLLDYLDALEFADALAMAYMEAWTPEEIASEQMNRRPETGL